MSVPNERVRTAPHADSGAQHDRFRLLVESVRDYAITMLDENGVIQTWNAGVQRLKGYSETEIVGRSMSVFYTDEDRRNGLPQKLLARATKEGRAESEGWRVRKDGALFWADVVITALHEDDGRLVGFAKVTRDLTERRKFDEALRRSEERFRLLVERVQDYAIFMLASRGFVQTWNSGAERIKQYKASEIVGRHFSTFYEPEDIASGKCDREIADAIRTGTAHDEGWRVRKDGSRFWANVVITALHGPAGDLVGFAKVTRDLSERKQAEDERMRLLKASEAIRLRDEFLAIASHELKTPLTAMQLQLQALAQRFPDPEVSRRILRAKQSGDRLSALIDSLFDVSRITTGQYSLQLEAIDIGQVVEGVVEGFQGAAAATGTPLTVQVPDSLVGIWDRVRVEQILANLISNALKYGAGSPVDVSVSKKDDSAVVEVRDQGPGIRPEDAQRIFQRFERAASPRHYGGLGLGLFVTREIVEAHGGTVEVLANGDKGACFRVQIPMSPRRESSRNAQSGGAPPSGMEMR